MKTFSAKPSDLDKKWLLIDAEGLVHLPMVRLEVEAVTGLK